MHTLVLLNLILTTTLTSKHFGKFFSKTLEIGEESLLFETESQATYGLE